MTPRSPSTSWCPRKSYTQESAFLTSCGRLAHILHLTNNRNDLVVQVLRHDAQNPTRGGGLTVFGFGHRGTPVGFSTTLFGPSTYYQDTTDIAIMSRVFDRMRTPALSPRASLRLIEQILEGME
ncbi:Scr1 family TA system antitoxin-like transcriptional regulator [Saccharopolyspora sp. ASAGF58]|uniref:Scr1 family TA system antitoxin-like transcriptional regulator n=1 Tax=Saccharopolyspora sp. ASAGF58 TaxID=2719023 RepID=UPI0035300C75